MTPCNLPSIYDIFGISEEAIQELEAKSLERKDFACAELCSMALDGNVKALQLVRLKLSQKAD